MEFINNWKEKELENYIKRFDKEMQHIEQLEKECKQRNWKINTLEEYKQIPLIFKQFRFSKDKKTFTELAKKEIDNHFNKLQTKVEKIIGHIIKIEATGENGYDYIFVGDKGNCSIEVILAGGHNIQRLHTRWIVKK